MMRRQTSFFAVAAALFLVVPSALAAEAQYDNLRYYYPVPIAESPQTQHVDVCVYGDSPGSVAAAIQAARMGRSVALYAFNRHIGGLTSGGLTATDLGRKASIGGIAKEFYDRLGRWTDFSCSAAEALFVTMLGESQVAVGYEHRLQSVQKQGNRITGITFENGDSCTARMFIDGTYEGDLLAMAGVSFHCGREGNARYGETINGVQFRDAHNFVLPVDPYVVEGDPSSGLLWEISSDPPGKTGDPDSRIQAYNFRMQITNTPDRVIFPKPKGYDPSWYALLARYLQKQPEGFWIIKPQFGPLQLRRGDSNNQGAFSTDFIWGSQHWPLAGYAEREAIFQRHVQYQMGLMYFLANDPQVPAQVREAVARWGLDPREFTATGHWPHQLYIREARRMISDYVMTEADCLGRTTVPDAIGLASYTMDSHNCQRYVATNVTMKGVLHAAVVRNEGDVQVRCPRPYPVAYRSIVPKEAECANLLVPVCLSSSHIAYGSIRMEPVFMILGQSAGTAAALAITTEVPVQRVDVAKLQEHLLADHQFLTNSAPRADALPAVSPVLPTALFKNLRAGKAQTVVAYGTSLTANGAWVPMLQEWFDARYKGLVTVVNSGKSGMHSDWGLANVQKQVVDKKPDLIFLEFGMNDAVLRFNISTEKARANLDGMLKAIQDGNPQADIVLMTMNTAIDIADKTSGSTRPKLADYYANYTACATERKLALVDNFPSWRNLAETDDKMFATYVPDGVHPTKEGIVAITWPNMEKLLLAAETEAKP
jgi:lysophospholipase L1-like esterase